MICFDGPSPTQSSFQKEEHCKVGRFRFRMKWWEQRLVPAFGSNHILCLGHRIVKQKHFHTAFHHTHFVPSAWSCCGLHLVNTRAPWALRKHRAENDVGLCHVCHCWSVYKGSWCQGWGTSLCENWVLLSCLAYSGSGVLVANKACLIKTFHFIHLPFIFKHLNSLPSQYQEQGDQYSVKKMLTFLQSFDSRSWGFKMAINYFQD